jgi:uncharacterized protein with HEPN domain
MSFESYRRDAKTRFAVERGVEIVSEAVRRLPPAICQEHQSVPWDDIRGIGNILRHNYDRVDDRIIWHAVERHLDPLESALVAIGRRHLGDG